MREHSFLGFFLYAHTDPCPPYRCWAPSWCPHLMMKWQRPVSNLSVRTSSKREVSGSRLLSTHFYTAPHVDNSAVVMWLCILINYLSGAFSVSLCLSLVVNVMQRDSIPSEVDYETRQGVYSICLQLARCSLIYQSGCLFFPCFAILFTLSLWIQHCKRWAA